MKKVKVRELILGVAIVAILCCISTVNYATTPDVNDLIRDPNTVSQDSNKIQNITELPTTNTTNNNNVANLTRNNTTNNTNVSQIGKVNNTTNNTTLPKTGVDDTMMWILIGVSAIAAIYTYKKVRDYNV